MDSQKDTTKVHIGQEKSKRTEKLITAIFMVTDLIDQAEPLRKELRSVSLKLITGQQPALISQTMSLIGIASSIGLISDMNAGILTKELSRLADSLPTLESLNFAPEIPSRTFRPLENNVLYKTPILSVKKSPISPVFKNSIPNESKSDRRDMIIKLIREKREVTIKDISGNISGCSEKTIQRELISMLKDKVIEKTGEKRWSRYFLSRNS